MFGAMRQSWSSIVSNRYWISNFNGTGISGTDNASAAGLALDPVGNILLAGGDYTAASPQPGFAMEMTIAGAVTWSKTYLDSSSSGQQTIVDIIADQSGNIYGVGGSASGEFLKLSQSNGASSFSKRWRYSTQTPTSDSIAYMPNGNIAVAYTVTFTGSSPNYAVLVVYNSSGGVVWQRYIGGAYESTGAGIGVDSSNNLYFLVGTNYSSSLGSNVQVNLIKYDSTGALQWQKKLDNGAPASQLSPYDVVTDSSGNSYITLTTLPVSVPGAGNDNYLIKIDTSGSLIWQRRITVTTNQALVGRKVSIDKTGNIYIVGYFVPDSSLTDVQAFLCKYNSSGTLIWQRAMSAYIGGAYINFYGEDVVFNYNNDMIVAMSMSSTVDTMTVMTNANDGSYTGSYTVGATTYNYYATSFTESSGVLSINTSTLSDNTVGGSVDSYTVSDTTITLTENIFNVPGSGSIPPLPTYNVDYLIVAGGGGGAGSTLGAGYPGAGGGAGGLLSGTTTLTYGTTYSFTVGGGASGSAGSSAGNGSNSTGFSFTAVGGGGGGINANGNSGGSGGGAYGYPNGTYAGGLGTAGQGYNGGTGYSDNSTYTNSGGGGGAGVGGTNATGSTAGNGGDGLVSSITGTATYYAGGGGGAFTNSAYPGVYATGGQGGGGNGGNIGSFPVGSGNGVANSGGGGGGVAQITGGNGGSGVVIIRVPSASYSGIVTGSPTVTTDGASKVIKFTSSGSYTA